MNSTISFLKIIVDKNRLSILYSLRNKELCVCDLMQLIPLTQGALSIQLKNLSKENLLNSRKDGKWVFYRLSGEINTSHKQILDKIFNEIKNDAHKKQINKIGSQSCKN